MHTACDGGAIGAWNSTVIPFIRCYRLGNLLVHLMHCRRASHCQYHVHTCHHEFIRHLCGNLSANISLRTYNFLNADYYFFSFFNVTCVSANTTRLPANEPTPFGIHVLITCGRNNSCSCSVHTSDDNTSSAKR